VLDAGVVVAVSVDAGVVEDCDVVASFEPHPVNAMVRERARADKISKIPIFFTVFLL